MSEARQSLAEYVTPDVDEARLARQRAAVGERMRRRPRWWLIVGPAVAVLALIALVIVRSSFATSAPIAGTVVEAPVGTPLPITLLDGSKLVLDPESKLSMQTLLPKDIRLELARGGIECEVTHVEGRQFVIVAEGYEVRVIGTHFTVRTTPDLEVRVARGRVQVTRIGDSTDVRVLSAGETWSRTLAAAPTPSPSAAPIVEESAPSPSASIVVAPATPVGPSPKELWDKAESARADRRYEDEAAALNQLRTKHRKDPRAGVAAFELGRLRQDTLHDPARAAEAFADAIALSPNGPFREDAEARRVEALDAAGRRDQCLEAKAAFLARYAGGIHRQKVSASCESR